jgi:hypothetical protein
MEYDQNKVQQKPQLYICYEFHPISTNSVGDGRNFSDDRTGDEAFCKIEKIIQRTCRSFRRLEAL